MHKFNLEIEIPDKDYCNGCPYVVKFPNSQRCDIFKQVIINNFTRPDICKQNDKEKTNNVV